VAVPIFQTSTYVHEALGKNKGYEYARVQNPTRTALEQCIAALERGHDGHAFATGMAAIATLMTLLESGQHTVVSRNVYGGTYRFFTHVLERYGLTFSWVDTSDLDQVRAALRPETRMVYVETPTNPMMDVTDIAAAAELAHEHGCVLAVDNTFLSPYFQRPLALGADVVIHSATKYLNGHSDAMGGLLVSSNAEHAEWFDFVSKSWGNILAPFECFLVMRGIKTLAVRMRCHEENTRRIVAMLEDHPKVRRILYPGLPGHPGHEVQKRQASGFGGTLAFDVGGLEEARRVLDGVQVFSLAESLGGVESLISHPATMTHASVPAERRTLLGIGDGLVRISVGIEDADDLLADLEQALA
jgi:cystathionine beta-lyase/cystathionine gamma-synthase